jgi:chaperonin cofactor prefoldin
LSAFKSLRGKLRSEQSKRKQLEDELETSNIQISALKSQIKNLQGDIEQLKPIIIDS